MIFECKGWKVYFIPTNDKEVKIFLIDERIINLIWLEKQIIL